MPPAGRRGTTRCDFTRPSGRLRRGASTVEAAIVLPVVFLFSIGTVVIGQGIYCYQQVASLAREGARYASVHGTQYAADTGNSVPNATTGTSIIYNTANVPLAVGLNSSSLTPQIQWGTAASGSWVWTAWPDSSLKTTPPPPGPAADMSSAKSPMYNAVQVTVTDPWTRALYLTGPINLTSSCVMPMSY